MKTITAKCTADGYLRYGTYTLSLSDEEYEEFSKLSESEKGDWIKEGGSFELDDYELNDTDIYEINE